MQCPACGAENLQGAQICEECRTPIPDTPEASEPTFVGKNRTLSDPISKAGTGPSVIAHRNTSVLDVVRDMRAKNTGCALIVESSEVVGIFTERDIVHRVAKPEMDLTDLEVGNVMTPAPEVLNESATFADALNKMAMGNYRHVPVRRSDGTFAVFSVRDALNYFY